MTQSREKPKEEVDPYQGILQFSSTFFNLSFCHKTKFSPISRLYALFLFPHWTKLKIPNQYLKKASRQVKKPAGSYLRFTQMVFLYATNNTKLEHFYRKASLIIAFSPLLFLFSFLRLFCRQCASHSRPISSVPPICGHFFNCRFIF